MRVNQMLSGRSKGSNKEGLLFSQPPAWSTFVRLLKIKFDETYSPDGVDLARGTANGLVYNLHAHDIHNDISWKIRLTSFFGLANRNYFFHPRTGNPTLLGILKGMVFWPRPGAPIWQKFLQFGFMLTGIPLAFNLLSAILSTVTHTAMLLTELFQGTLADYFKAVYDQRHKDMNANP